MFDKIYGGNLQINQVSWLVNLHNVSMPVQWGHSTLQRNCVYHFQKGLIRMAQWLIMKQFTAVTYGNSQANSLWVYTL